MKHGRYRYKRGCRCEVCVTTERAYRRAVRAAKVLRDPPEGAKHGNYVYTEYGCRCETCRAAHAAVMMKWKQGRKVRALKAFFEERQARARAG